MKRINYVLPLFTLFLFILVSLSPRGYLQAQSPSVATLEKVAVYPSLIVYNGKIAAMDSSLTFYEAMAVRGDRIWMLGTNQEIRELTGPQTQVIDLKGRTVVPGLIDTHTHPQLWGWWHFGAEVLSDLEPAYARGKDIEEVKLNLRRVINERIRKQGKDQWVISSVPHRFGEVPRYPQHGYLFPNFEPPGRFRRNELESIAPDTPVVIVSGCCSGVANSKARQKMVEVLGYEPSSGVRIGYDLVWGVLLKGKTELAADLASREMRDFVKYGVTTVGSHGEVNTEFFRALHMLDRQGKMPQRFAWSHEHAFFASKDPEQFYRLLGNFLGQGSDFLWNVGVGWEAWNATSGGCTTAILKEPPPPRSQPQVPYPDACLPADSIEWRAHLAAAEAGLRLFGLHSTGDKILDRAAAIAEEAIRKGTRTLEDIREQMWEFAHNPWIRPDQIPLIKKYNFRPNLQGGALGGLGPRLYDARNFYRPEYVAWVYPVKTLVDAGIPFSIGTDVGISQLTDDQENFLNSLSVNFPYRNSIWPYIGVWVQPLAEIVHGEFGSGERRTETVALAPQQRIDRISALRAMTNWPAETLLRGDRLGSLEPGKLADFVVIDKDYFTIPEPEIMKLQTLMTVLGGKIAYQDPNF